MSDIEHGKKIIKTPQDDGSLKIREEGYFNGLNSIEETTRVNVSTSQATVLSDVIKCLDILKTDSPELTIVIKKDNSGFPKLIQKEWVVYKEKLK